MVLLAERDRPDPFELVKTLRGAGLPFFGGVFPALMSGDEWRDRGAVICRVPLRGALRVVQGLDRADYRLPDLDDWADRREDKAAPLTVLILADGMAPQISPCLAAIFNLLGPAVHYLGGGAGTTELRQQPCVFTSDGVFQNAAVLAGVGLRCALGVRHGLERMAGPIVATRTEDVHIMELNWRPALEVYRRAVERDDGRPLTSDNFYGVGRAWAYPLGLFREGSEDVVREPLSANEAGAIRCGGSVPGNTVVHILTGRPEALIAAAGQAAGDAVGSARGQPALALVCDCISRRMFLGERTGEEVRAVIGRVRERFPGLAVEGALTLGEIASIGESVLEFLNKTLVVGVLGHD